MPADAAGFVIYPERDGWAIPAQREAEVSRPLFLRITSSRSLRKAARKVSTWDGPVVVSHASVLGCDADLVLAAVAFAESNPNVWVCTSLLGIAGFVPFAAQRVPDRLVFGSTFPSVDPRTAWAHIASALPNASDHLLAAIGTTNAARLQREVQVR